MNTTVTLASTKRILNQLRHDRRILALMLLVPTLLMILLRYVFDNELLFNRIAPALLGIFPFVIMFLITSIATLRERTTGTLERLMSMPLAKLDLLVGYGAAFAAVAVVQGVVTAGVAFGLLDIHTSGPVWAVVLLAVANAIVGMALGLFLSAFARSEFQAVQFMPAFIVPQLLLAGLFLPRDRMPQALQTISDVLPFTYAYEALSKVAADDIDGRLWLDVGVVCGCIVLALVLGAGTLRRRTP